MVDVCIALGSNIGDRLENLKQGLTKLEAVSELIAWSPVYETAPKYVTDQPAFLNMTARGETDLKPRELLDKLKAFERELGRTEGERYGPRVIDLDIIFYGRMVIDEPGLRVPHPRIAERDFVLRPLADIANDWRHTETGKSASEMLVELGARAGEIVPYPIEV